MAAARAPSEASIVRELTAVSRRKARTKAQDDAAAEERDRLIRDAIQVKIPRARIVEITGLSPQRIDQIRRGARL
jgi:hypothetical protein